MKRIHKPFIKGINWVIGSLMSLLGFGSNTCENATEEYGVPHTCFSVKNNAQEEKTEHNWNDLHTESL
ncbi:MAG: hypothetical protein LUE98_13430 [Tannerellaceae bacterium]|nr:hypothetical protein [Tannerellaceae bacterium]